MKSRRWFVAILLLLLAASTGFTVGAEPPTAHAAPEWVPDRPLYGADGYRTVLLPLLKSADGGERARAAFVIGMIGDRPLSGRLATMLKDEDRTARVFAGLALGFMGDERGIHVCDAALKADPDWIRYYAVYALWMMDSPRARAVLERNRDGRGPFIGDVLRQALTARRPKSYPAVEKPVEVPKPEDLYASFCDAFIMEADKWWHRGDFFHTIRCQEAAVFIDPTYADGYSLMAWLQWSMGDDDTALKTLDRGIKAIPDSPDTWGALGQHYWLTKRYELALAPLSKSIELGADHLIRRTYAYCLEKTGRLEECLVQWEVIVKEAPDDPAAPLNLERMRKKVAEQSGDQ